ncbi:MAG: LPXTG cell wall anchor domain-containing protein [Vagococcus sp.]|uniref:LPXTG cell wall anchor domain-containing protein n=1 Tax=Vagococcus TaxID=2737 RepID=UPI002FCCB317
MRKLKIYSLLVCLVSLIIFSPTITKAEISETKNNLETKTEIEIKKGPDKVITKDEETIYEPSEPKPIRILPQTGEIITTFIYVIVGLSLLIFLIGILINRMTREYIRWEY